MSRQRRRKRYARTDDVARTWKRFVATSMPVAWMWGWCGSDAGVGWGVCTFLQEVVVLSVRDENRTHLGSQTPRVSPYLTTSHRTLPRPQAWHSEAWWWWCYKYFLSCCAGVRLS